MRAMILAAGLGTRLGSLSDERPKPLLPLCDQPLLRYNLALLAGHGFDEVVINLHHRGELIRAELASWSGPPLISWSEERELLGTGGGIHRVADWLTDGGRAPFLILNGKLVIDPDLGALVARHRERGAAATMLVREVPDAERWGAIDLDEDDRVVGILGERVPERAVARRTMFTGVHVISPALAARLPEGVSCVIRQGYLPALRAGEPIAALRYAGYFEEHSTPRRYLDGNFAVLDGKAALRHPPGALVGVDPTAHIGAGAELRAPLRIGPGAVIGAGAVIGPHAVIGRGARVAPGARVERAVAWPDAVVTGAVRDAIVTTQGVYPVD